MQLLVNTPNATLRPTKAQKLSMAPEAKVHALQARHAKPSYFTLLGDKSVIVPMKVPKKISGSKMASPLSTG